MGCGKGGLASCQPWLECYRSNDVYGLASVLVSAGLSFGSALQEKRGKGRNSMCLLLMLCACQSRPFSCLRSPLSSSSACPSDAWQTADPLSQLSNRPHPPYCLTVTCLYSLTQFIVFFFPSQPSINEVIDGLLFLTSQCHFCACLAFCLCVSRYWLKITHFKYSPRPCLFRQVIELALFLNKPTAS